MKWFKFRASEYSDHYIFDIMTPLKYAADGQRAGQDICRRLPGLVTQYAGHRSGYNGKPCWVTPLHLPKSAALAEKLSEVSNVG